ncbi:MAG: PAS domain-containing sensor histidine kinase [Mangrovibacterium sp.]
MRGSFLFNILSRLLFIILLAAGIGYSGFAAHCWLVVMFLTVILVVTVCSLLHYQNRINEQISYFFEAVKNEDFSLVFPEKKDDRLIRKLNRNMAEVNRQIQQISLNHQRQEQYFRALLEHVGTGILSFDERGFVVHANSYIKKLLGMEQLTHLRQLEKVDIRLAQAFRQMKEREQKQISFNGSRGQINLLVQTTVFKAGEQQLMLFSVQDINQELDEKELDSWLKLIRVLTHEIMNTIAPVTSLSESLGNYYFKDGKVISREEVSDRMIAHTVRGLEVIREQGKGLVRFVELYRQFTRIPKPEKKPVRVDQLLERTVILRQTELAKAGISHMIRLKNPELQVLADETLIAQVLGNLLKNALEALKGRAGGHIELTAGKNAQEQVEIAVHDNGPGIPPELLSDIFVPFFTTRKEGNGIGLSLSRQIMRLHGGTLSVHSVPERETVFTMLF